MYYYFVFYSPVMAVLLVGCEVLVCYHHTRPKCPRCGSRRSRSKRVTHDNYPHGGEELRQCRYCMLLWREPH